MLAKVCTDLGMDIQIIGGSPEQLTSTPETILVNSDLVFASARAALESICAGCAVVVCDARGVAGMATEENFDRWRTRNFGLRTLTLPPTAKTIRAEIERYDAVAATALATRARRETDFELGFTRYLKFYRRAIKRLAKRPVSIEQHAIAVSAFLRNVLPRSLSPELSMEAVGRDTVGKLLSLMDENLYLKNSLAAAQLDSDT
jgi:hypothetical protein